MAEHNDFGKLAEDEAVNYLKRKAYRIAFRNYRYGKAEIDILAFDNEVLVVIEVKARSTGYFGDPEQFVSKRKIQFLINAVNKYVEQNNLDVEIRFDIIAILKQKDGLVVNHIEDAFYFF
ncbi:UPF0102 protein [Neptunitalea chrysea]|uniref:UPF0102 protein NBRC110019_17400 n=1 Tax=Neptunitalea chrysea TaxID=1647581 RepID=A0A9W6ETX1_9FLAO|nr:YraN family protein [Neptunitalea chrysea]GLB52700.1 UPF0102 protein [Neptunitalea chrysea]